MARPGPVPRSEEDVVRVTADPNPGRSLATHRAIRDVVRNATMSVYGVSGFAGGGAIGRLFERLGLAHPGLHVEVGETLSVDLNLAVAYGLPVAEVARQVESSVRYAISNAFGREPERISIRIGRLRHEQGIAPSPHESPSAGEARATDLAGSGTDVA